jgi:beta-galactosidase/beta-glucuronidase
MMNSTAPVIHTVPVSLGGQPDTGLSWPTDHPEYPRQLCQRENWQNLNGVWDFCFDDAGSAGHPRQVSDWGRDIIVPFAPESDLSGIGDQSFHSHVWYRRQFEVDLPAGSRLLLHFGAVDYRAKVWLNDVFVGGHEGGHTPFTIDVTDAMVAGTAQTVAVHAIDDPHDLTKPRGKQDWQLEPHSIWYPRTTGIWQTVWAEVVPSVRLDRLHWSPNFDRSEIGFHCFVACHSSEGLEVRVRLRVGSRVLADDRYQVIENEVHRRIALSDPGIDDYRNELLWTPESPTLITAEVDLVSGGRLLDTVRSYTALRGIDLARGRFLLNNRPYFLRLVLNQGYWPESLMTPPSEEAIIRDIELIKAAGFNGVRMHQKIEDPRFLYWADRLGLMVWEEMPSAYRFTHESVERLTREWMEVIDRDSNHPSIIVWVPFNESWGVPNLPHNPAHRNYVQALYHLTKTLDPSRPVIGNDGWESSATDIVGIHDYDDDPGRIMARYRVGEADGALGDVLINGWPGGRILTLEEHPHEGDPVMLTEFGGIAHRDERDIDQEEVWGYSVGRSSTELQQRHRDLLDAVNRVEGFAGFCYTQFADTFQEANGLFFVDRTPKFDLAAMSAATRGSASLPHEVPL